MIILLSFQFKKYFHNKNMMFQFFVLPSLLILLISYLLISYFDSYSLAVYHYFFSSHAIYVSWIWSECSFFFVRYK